MRLVELLSLLDTKYKGRLAPYYKPDGEPRPGPGDPLAEFIVATVRAVFHEGRPDTELFLAVQRALGDARADIRDAIFALQDAWLTSVIGPARKDL